MAERELTWISIRRAKALADAQDPEETVSRRQFLRRLRQWDVAAGGKLLRWRGKPRSGGALQVNCAVLRQIVRADPLAREVELADIHNRLTVLDHRTKSLNDRTTEHARKLRNHDKALEAIKMMGEAQSQLNQAILAR